MRIFLDTSSLIKLYFPEVGSEALDNLFEKEQIEVVYLSEIAKVEFNSAVWKKVRTKELSSEDAISLINAFKTDFDRFDFINVSAVLITEANKMLAKYGVSGLRTLDAIQLATALSLRKQIRVAFTSDLLLQKFMEEEELKCG